MPKKTDRVPVTQRALVQRINRALARVGRFGRVMKKTRGVQAHLDLGDYYVLDVERNLVVDKYVDAEALGRELGVLHDFERLAK